MATDLDDQLTSYFAWVEQQLGMPMRRPPHDPSAVHHGSTGSIEVRSFDRPNRSGRRRPWAYVGAGSLVAGLIIAITIVAQGRPDPVAPADNSTSADTTTADSLSDDPSATPATEPTSIDIADSLAPGATEVLPQSPLQGRTDPMAVWTGTRMIIWGGSAPKPITGETPFADGASYNPITRQWTRLPDAPISARSNAAAVWTGTEMIIWGGSNNGTSLTDGAAYNPATNTWRTIPSVDLAATIRPTTLWTGSEMIVLEGFNGSPRGAALNPTTNTWRTIATPPGRSTPPYPQAVWTGTEAVVTLNAGSDDSPIIAAYNPALDQWDTITTDVASGQTPFLLWTGTDVLAFAMTDSSGGAWNPATRTWRTVARPGNVSTNGAQPIWTGTTALFWTGRPSITTYKPADDTWLTVPGGQLPEARLDGAHVWASGILLTWGGFVSNPDGSATGADDGIAWRPEN
jgi:hypothetical protein